MSLEIHLTQMGIAQMGQDRDTLEPFLPYLHGKFVCSTGASSCVGCRSQPAEHAAMPCLSLP